VRKWDTLLITSKSVLLLSARVKSKESGTTTIITGPRTKHIIVTTHITSITSLLQVTSHVVLMVHFNIPLSYNRVMVVSSQPLIVPNVVAACCCGRCRMRQPGGLLVVALGYVGAENCTIHAIKSHSCGFFDSA